MVGNNSNSIANNDAAIATNQGIIVNVSSNIETINVSLFWFLIKEVTVSKQLCGPILTPIPSSG